jgi:hypothetical protein
MKPPKPTRRETRSRLEEVQREYDVTVDDIRAALPPFLVRLAQHVPTKP